MHADLTHVVVTRYDPGAPRRVIVHAYGPYTESRATTEVGKLRRRYPNEIVTGKLEVRKCKMIETDPDLSQDAPE